MKAAIIGCNGYLGKHLCLYLIQKGWYISGYDIAESSLTTISEYYSVNITQKNQLKNIDLNIDYLFYFSGITGTLNAYDKYESFIDVNEKGLLYLLDYLRQSNSKARFIFPSTRLVYKGKKNKKIDENSEKEFKTIYSLNKWFGEQVICQYSNYFNLKFNIFRICVPYGNLFNKEYSYGTIGFFLSNALAKKNIVLFGNGEQKRTFTHVEDICSQIYDTIIKPKSENEILNIYGETFSLKEIAKLIALKYGVDIENKEWPDLLKQIESGDTVFNSSKIQKFINISLKFTFNKWLNSL